MGADAESSCTESRTDSWAQDGARNPWSAPTIELWAPTGLGSFTAGAAQASRCLRRCATFLDPDPDDGETQQQRCESLLERAGAADPPLAHIDLFDEYDCAAMVERVWPDPPDPARDKACFATADLGWMWLEKADGGDSEQHEAKGTVFFC